MNTRIIARTASLVATAAATAAFVVGGSTMAVFAASGSSGTRGASSLASRIAGMQARGAKEIDARVKSLTDLATRLQDLRNLTDAQKNSLIGTIQNLIANLNTLKAQIGADTSTTTVKADDQAITQNFRVYALVAPQLHIIASADRIITISNMLTVISGKISARLSAAGAISGLAALQEAVTDMNTKINDAKTQAQAAVNEVTTLAPDQGDKTKMAANVTALKDARTKLQAAQKDLVAARKDAQTVITALVKSDKAMMNGAMNTPNTSTTSTTPTTNTTSTSSTSTH